MVVCASCGTATQAELGTRPPLREAARRRGAAEDAQPRGAAKHSSDLAAAMLVLLAERAFLLHHFAVSQRRWRGGWAPLRRANEWRSESARARNFVTRFPFAQSFSRPQARASTRRPCDPRSGYASTDTAPVPSTLAPTPRHQSRTARSSTRSRASQSPARGCSEPSSASQQGACAAPPTTQQPLSYDSS